MRNERYRKNAISVRERHNERKNEVYSNPDVLLEYSHNNVIFKACEAATYAKQFYAEVYELAKEIAGGEQYIISAVMHADERNREASDRLGRNVFHYHLHVVYLPVVEKQIRWSKRCKDPALRGTVRETIMQVSHSKKWLMVPMTDEQGQPVLKKNSKPRLVSSYSLLQTRFFEHMRQAGFTDFERGVQGSPAERSRYGKSAGEDNITGSGVRQVPGGRRAPAGAGTFVRLLLPQIQAFYQSEAGQRLFKEWKEKQQNCNTPEK